MPPCNLGDMGADVIKVEDPGQGDTTRGFPPHWNGESTYYMSTNRNKRGMILDLNTDRGRDIALKLALRSDVLIENFRAGQMEKWGLGWDRLHAAQSSPHLLCRISRGS